ncbi:serine hydrolase [Enhygromyxa salina]|uniref:Beta-lactamase class A catalytic domain-containing protein n=1 Tax=Enhygromyxa salina TaxID=215803 RepID=A0A2S9YP47_9BACT|nr:serine hydrolase [Enhygromyxa salina]PRQ06857.1 hypothetical protein ENSA7_33950 [Enhygromyxa salina]
MPWNKIGGPAHSLAIYAGRLAALTPDRKAIYTLDPASGEWAKIGGAMTGLVGGGWDLYATAANGDLHRYDGVSWAKVGGPGAQFVGICNAVYSLGPSRDRVDHYDRLMNKWTKIGGPAQSLIAGGSKVYAAAPENRAIFAWSRYDKTWTEIGGAGSMWVGVGPTVYGLTPDRQAVFRYDGTPKQWTKVGGPVERLIGGGSVVYAVQPKTKNLLRYRGSGQTWDVVGTPGVNVVAFDHTLYSMTLDKKEVHQLDEANAETRRLRELMWGCYGHPHHSRRSTCGFLVKQLGKNGAIIAEHAADVCVQPLSVLKLVPYLHAIREVDSNPAVSMATTVSWFESSTATGANKTDTTCLGKARGNVSNSAPLSEALPTMMWESHNRTLDAVMEKFDIQQITRSVQALGLVSTEMYYGCKQATGPNVPWADNLTTLVDMARLYEGIDDNSFVTKAASRTLFETNMIVMAASNPQYTSAITGRSSGPVSANGFRELVEAEAAPLGKLAIVPQFMPLVVRRWKGGSGGPTGIDTGYSDAATLSLPFKVGGATVMRDYFLGWWFSQIRNPNSHDPGPPNAEPYLLGSSGDWTKIGTPGAMWVAVGSDIYGLTSNKKEVWRYSGSPTWTKVGGPAERLIGGDAGLFAIHPDTGDIHRYSGTGQQWQRIGGPGASFAAAGNTIYGLTPGRDAIYRYNGTPDSWTKVRGPAADLIGGGNTIYAINSNTQDVEAYSPGGASWVKIGGPGVDFVADGSQLFGMTTDRKQVWSYTGTPNSWTQVGGPAAALAIAGGSLYGLASVGGALFRYSGSGMAWSAVEGGWASLVGGGTRLAAVSSSHRARQQFSNALFRQPIRDALATW